MKSDHAVMLDACVLLPMPLVDTLLRMAEAPRLFLPRWSEDILEEVSRTLITKLGKTPEQSQRREQALRSSFPEALVGGYTDLIKSMTNDVKDRHILAATVVSDAKMIVTYNRKDFPAECLRPYDIECCGPSTFLIDLYDLEPGIVAQKLIEQAQNIGLTIEQLLHRLSINVPGFCRSMYLDSFLTSAQSKRLS
jgi:predicted nucleic acid-binding protein